MPRYFYPFLRQRPNWLCSAVGMDDGAVNDQLTCSYQRLADRFEYVRFSYADRGQPASDDLNERIEAVIDAGAAEAQRAGLAATTTQRTLTVFGVAAANAGLSTYRKIVQQSIANFRPDASTENAALNYLDRL